MSGQVYLVQRRAISHDIYGSAQIEHPAVHPGGGFVPWKALRLFADQRSARAFADEVRSMIRLETNPFQLAWDVTDLTSLGEDDFCLTIAEMGLPLPPYDGYDLAQWWAENAARMTDAQRDGVWALCDRLELVRVVPLPLDDC